MIYLRKEKKNHTTLPYLLSIETGTLVWVTADITTAS